MSSMIGKSSYRGRETWAGLESKQADITSARDALFKDAQDVIEELTRQLVDLSENFEGQKLRNLKLKGDNEQYLNQVEEMKSALNAYEKEKSLVVCLIDGDGAVFHEDLLVKGKEGGHEAAGLLRQGIVRQFEQEPREIKTMVFINVEGLGKTLERNSVCTTKEFGQFIVGFNQASPLFTIVDVGYGKEAADTKLKDNLRLFLRLSETRQVFFCGAHDGGYAPILKSLQTENHLHKLTVLEGSIVTAAEYKRFFDQSELKVISIPDLFTRKRLASGAVNGSPRAVAAIPAAAPKQLSPIIGPPPGLPARSASSGASEGGWETVRPRSPITNGASTRSFSAIAASAASIMQTPPTNTTPHVTKHILDRKKLFTQQTPRLCNFYYLGRNGCNNGDTCGYSHGYTLLEADLEAYAKLIKQVMPCMNMQNYGYCQVEEECFMGHACPGGLRCTRFKIGTCKWNADGMHDA
ncbi:hypothetical protein FRB95_006095 [Tulasnella sp. JGI-2019a]|nr:hypothetical protein FRB95_006095 [Tulasnella sp. JGI-2019a]